MRNDVRRQSCKPHSPHGFQANYFFFREELRRGRKLAASKEMKQSSSFKSAGPQRKAKLIQLHKQAILTAIVGCEAFR